MDDITFFPSAIVFSSPVECADHLNLSNHLTAELHILCTMVWKERNFRMFQPFVSIHQQFVSDNTSCLLSVSLSVLSKGY